MKFESEHVSKHGPKWERKLVLRKETIKDLNVKFSRKKADYPGPSDLSDCCDPDPSEYCDPDPLM